MQGKLRRNKMRMKSTTMLALIAVAAFAVVADAAVVTWSSSVFENYGSVNKFMGTNQFNTAGTQILADNTGGSADTYDGISYTAGAINMGSLYGSYHDQSTPSDFGTYNSSAGAKTVTLGAGGAGTIVSGLEYRIQLLVMDGRSTQAGKNVEVDGVDQGVYSDGVSGVTYGDGLLITGTFTADSSSQTFDIEVFDAGGLTSDGGQLNVLLLHQIPEPATLSIIASVGGALVFIRRKFMI